MMRIEINLVFIKKFFVLLIILLFGIFIGFLYSNYLLKSETSGELINPFVNSESSKPKPLQKYAISQLQTREYKPSNIVLTEVITEEPSYKSFTFSYTTLGKQMTGQINIPDKVTANPIQTNKAIILLRGYVPEEIYTTGSGTRNAADRFAQAGYITIAPDFFGYGNSDPEPENSWQTRFEKPITVIELIKSIELNGIPLDLDSDQRISTITDIGMWAHSNGGQIALTTIEIMGESIPTSLWAPVTAPFPYSVLFFSDELEDEGKAQRKWISLLEDEYDVFDFSLTQHLDKLMGPIQIQHGTADDAALIFWSREFMDKVIAENERRSELTASESAEPIIIDLIEHPNANHNMVPRWEVAIQNDLRFFATYLE